jgi:hypothetical protein
VQHTGNYQQEGNERQERSDEVIALLLPADYSELYMYVCMV